MTININGKRAVVTCKVIIEMNK